MQTLPMMPMQTSFVRSPMPVPIAQPLSPQPVMIQQPVVHYQQIPVMVQQVQQIPVMVRESDGTYIIYWIYNVCVCVCVCVCLCVCTYIRWCCCTTGNFLRDRERLTLWDMYSIVYIIHAYIYCCGWQKEREGHAGNTCWLCMRIGFLLAKIRPGVCTYAPMHLHINIQIHKHTRAGTDMPCCTHTLWWLQFDVYPSRSLALLPFRFFVSSGRYG